MKVRLKRQERHPSLCTAEGVDLRRQVQLNAARQSATAKKRWLATFPNRDEIAVGAHTRSQAKGYLKNLLSEQEYRSMQLTEF